MRILMLNYEFPPLGGGAANATYYLLKEFSKNKDLKIDLITASANNKYEIENISDNITLYRLNVKKKSLNYQTFLETIRWSFKTLKLVKRLVKKEEYDLCHCWFGWPSGFFGYLNEKRFPYIVALRGSDVPGYSPRFKFIDGFLTKIYSKVIWSRAKKTVANSKGLKELARKTWKGDIGIIYNGVDIKEFKPGKPRKKFTLLTVARLIPRKGIDYLIRAMPHINAELMIVGEGPEMSRLKQKSRDLGVSKKVDFLGYKKHKEISKLYKKSHIFILPSLNEGMSNTVLEAMASGLPIITTNTGGTAELIKNNGIIIKKKSTKEIVNAVNKLIKNKKTREKYAKNSRKIAEKMSWENVAKEYLDMYMN